VVVVGTVRLDTVDPADPVVKLPVLNDNKPVGLVKGVVEAGVDVRGYANL
jgi:hypothetical protein